LEEILSELDEDRDLTEPRLKFLLGLLILDLSQETPTKVKKVSYDKGILANVISYMEKNLKDANLNEISDELNVKNYNLSKLIKKESGVTFNTLLREIRLGKFCELIKVKNVSINDLAIEVGFSNTSDFYKKFKAKYGISPREYRNTQ
jgi:AraC-like DNA-binding protein